MELEFRRELETLINRHSMENGSNTPDYILCEYLMDCLAAFDRAVNARNRAELPPPLIMIEQPPETDSQ